MNSFITIKEIIRWANRNKATAALSISGMAVGITVALLIGFWSINEFSFDKFHKDYDRIYRTCLQGFINNESSSFGTEFAPLGPIAKDQFPEIEDMTRISLIQRDMIRVDGTTYYQDKIAATDKNLFTFFSFKLETGDPKTCLDSPEKVVIDRSFCNNYFNGKNPLGQTIDMCGKHLVVSAVMENVPENSHLKFHVVIPIESVDWLKNNTWGGNDVYLTYLKLKPNSQPDLLGRQITEMTYEHFPPYKQFKITQFLQPLQKIHFSSGFRFDSVITSDRRIVFIFISLAGLILLIATFNFINLFISTSFLRAKSIGIKKINGSSNYGLFFSSYLETSLYVLTAAILAIVIFTLSLPSFSQLSGTKLTIDLNDYKVYLYTGILLITTIFISGTIPVLYILRFNPEAIIRNRFKGSGVTLLQRTLVICQFTASIFLITSAGVIKKQINYIHTKDLGFNKEHIIYFMSKNLSRNYEPIRGELLRNPNILDVTAKSCLPYEWNNGNVISSADDPTKEYIMEVCEVKYNYADLLKIPLVAGRNPFTSAENNNGQCMINEQAATNLGLTDPIGKQIKRSGSEIYTIAGVLKNANTKSLHLKVDPQIYLPLNQVNGGNFIMVKTNDQVESVIHSLEAAWDQNHPEVPFEYHFLDDAYDKLYKTEYIASKIISIGMMIALFLAFMGLYAISHYATQRRVNEIGIRKVNGAKISEVIVMLNKDFIIWIIVAYVIAVPVTWFAMNFWLENFAFKTTLSWWIFALAGMLALGIAILTVSWQSWRAATRNSVESLRYE
ncbi:MAG TPA: ABC transporter permease [Prolixibacteraceae bacterium]|jgi:putative ABC transport system permease protein|nr:ABC transporter permease [Prolixibacteraceae bacterium]